MKKLTIKSWALNDRPREKLIAKGASALTDAELLAIVIGSGNSRESALALSKRILQTTHNNLNELMALSIPKLMQFKGIGEAKAVAIKTAFELGKRRFYERADQRMQIHDSQDVFRVISPELSDLRHEEFWVIYLNNSHLVLSKHQISKGGLTATVVDSRLVFKKALELGAVAIVLCHNHPSGNLQPSMADKELTEKIKRGSKSLDITLLDHLIVAQKSYFSFADEGIL